MKIKKQLSAFLLALSLAVMNGCGDSSAGDKLSSAADPSVSSSQAESSSAADSSSSAADSSSQAAVVYDYEHGTDGYYNLMDELKLFEMKTQQAGTCWLYAGRASMQTSYEKQTGKELKMEIYDILDTIYGAGKQEGFFVKSGVDKGELGGWQWMITDTLSRGYKDGITLDSSIIIDPTDREAIKNAIKTRGGIAAEVCDENVGRKYFGKYLTVNYAESDSYDHDLTLIGWDDHFPKDYFADPAKQDGAWIAYNSNIGSHFYYISYDSPFGYTISHTVSDKYSQVLSYDAGNEMDRYIKTGDSTKVANVFHNAGKLAAVGTFNDFDKQSIKIEIMSADLKNVLYTQDAVLDYHGCHTVELTKPVEVSDFAVVVTYEKGAPVEGELIDNGDCMYKTVSEKGQSFVFAGGTWKDLSDADAKSVLKTDFAPGNACIKALFVK
ncbi:MAG: hypothetical protein II168_02335 [Ruminococcus sp.]|nr:hypothetical protein [Ruminococcus sp.]